MGTFMLKTSNKYILITLTGLLLAGISLLFVHKKPQPLAGPINLAAGKAGRLTTTTPSTQPPTTTLFFAGDIMLSRNVEDHMAKASDYTLPFKKVADITRSADIAFANLESPFNDQGQHFIHNSLVFNADPKAVDGLKFAGFDVLSTANNHALDQGTKGVDFTRELLNQNGIIPTGTHSSQPNPILPVIQKNNIAYGFLSYSYTALNDGGKSTSPLVDDFNNLAQLKQDIWGLKGHNTDVVIVNMHAGTEYTRKPTQQQIDFAHAAIDAGADLVIGEHPHWVQTIEQYKGKWIFYSLGNFVFDQMWSQETREGLTLLVTYEKDQIKKIELQPVIIDDYCCPRWANPKETAAIFAKIGLTSAVIMSKN